MRIPGLMPEAARPRARMWLALASWENIQRRYLPFDGGEEGGVGGFWGVGVDVMEVRKVEDWCMQTREVRFGYFRAGSLRRS